MRIALISLCFLALLGADRASAETIYVSNELDDTVAVVDAGKLEVVASIPVGRRPRGMGLAKDGQHLFVAVGDDNRIDVIDLKSRKVSGHLPSGDDPELFAVHPDGRRLYVANENDNYVSVVDLLDERITAEIAVGIEPEGVAVSPDGATVVNTSETTSMAHFIDVDSGKLADSILVDTRPRFAQFTPDGKQVWVSSELGGTVNIIDSKTHEILDIVRFDVPGLSPDLVQPVGIKLSSDGKRAFVALGPANRVAELDQRNRDFVRYYLVGQRVWHMAFSTDQTRLYTANGNSGDISVIDLGRNRVIKSVPVGRAPWDVVVAQ
jgi:PQQ-dependent catabolism-associated beta-propeller protein